MTDWFRSWHGAPTDIKWMAVAKRAGVAPGMVVSVAWALMDRASQADNRGSIEGYDAEELAIFYGYETEQVEAVVAAMEARGVIVGGRFAAWERRQPKREDDSAERVKRHRERQKEASNAVKRDVTHRNAPEKNREEQSKKDAELRSERARAKPPDKPDTPPPERLALDAWNELAAECGLPHADVFDADRAGKIRARLRECGGLPGWEHALARIRGSPFLLGQVDGKDFRAHLDFVLQKSSFRKLMEGTYDGGNRKVSGQSGLPPYIAALNRGSG